MEATKRSRAASAIRWSLVCMIIIAMAVCGTITAGAAEHPTSIRHEGGFGTLLHPAKAKEEKSRYEEHAALVMFKDTSKLSKSEARNTLRGGTYGVEDIQVETIWNFETDPSSAASGDQEQVTPGSAAEEDSDVVKGTGASEGDGVSNGAQTSRGAKVSRGVKRSFSSVGVVRSKTLTTEQLIRKLKKRDDVLYAEPNYRVHMCSVDDPYFGKQWSMQGGAAGTPQYDKNTPNVSALWEHGSTGSEQIVAVVDTGVDYTHPDLENNMWHNVHQPALKGEFGFDFIEGDDDPMDENGHGTHCAGIIGAQGNNGIGISGVNQKIRIMALRVLDSYGSAYLSHEVAAYFYINKALELGEPVRAINNSWGGGEESAIFAELIDIVGEKGAVTIFAAGNEWNDNDEYAEYPTNIISPYMLKVAATSEDGELAGFSNYGKESVDVAAPGTEILSTVSYDCYNPSIYDSEQANLSAKYNDYESGEEWGSVQQLRESLQLNGEPYVEESGKAKISIEPVKDGFLNSDEGALEINVKKMRANDLVCMTVPYELDENAENAPFFSVVCKGEASKDDSILFGMIDVPQGTGLDIGSIGDEELLAGLYLYSNDINNWAHLDAQTMDDYDLDEILTDVQEAEESGEQLDPDPTKREIVIVMLAEYGGDATVHLDDMGLSRQDLPDTSVFGQYEFMSGTSMAAPFISGSAALLAAAQEQSGAAVDPELLVSEIAAMAKDDAPLPVAAGGAFDFTKIPEQLGPRIGKVLVDKAGGSITIKGTGLDPAGGLTVQVGPERDELQPAQIVSQTDREVVVKDDRWINNVEIVRVESADGRASSRSYIYLVDGKKGYTQVKGADDEMPSEGPMATDGRYIYAIDSSDGTILKLDTKKLKKGTTDIGEIDPSKIFKIKTNKDATYAAAVGDDLVYLNGKLYTVLEYGLADESELFEDDFWFFFSKGKGGSDKAHDADEVRDAGGSHGADDTAGDQGLRGAYVLTDDDEEDEEEGSYAIYSGDFRLISIDVKSGKVKNLGKLPASLTKTVDYTLAGYNGKLYFIGGYSYKDQSLTDQVKIYDPAKKKNCWSAGPALPEARAGGKAMQSGSSLIYTMGYHTPIAKGSEGETFHFPANMTLKGKKWTLSSMDADSNIAPIYSEDTVTRGGKKYPVATAYVSAVKNGLAYTGMPAECYGDTFCYNASKDAYQDTGYQFCKDPYSDIVLRGIAVGDKIYGFDEEFVYTAKAAGSNLVTVKVKKKGKGSVSGSTAVVAGNNAVFQVKAKKGHVIKSIHVGSKKVAVKKNATKKTVTLKNVVKNQTVKVVFK